MDAELRGRVLAAFARGFGGAPQLVAAAPGRVNLIGEHTDYNDGFVLPCAIGRYTLVAARARSDAQLRVVAADLGDASVSIDLTQPLRPDAAVPWSNYVRGVVAQLRAAGVLYGGAELAIASNVPQGAGLSSSAALEVATALALAALAGQPDFDRTQLALIGQRAEHEFAGCPCGIMDQLIAARGERSHALLIDCRSFATQPVRVPDQVAVMIVHSGITRGLVDGAYAERRAQCRAAADHFRARALRDVDLAALQRAGGELDALVYRRARHVVTENLRTLAAARCLPANDLVGLGRLMAESHASMRDDFAITLPAIDALVDLLQQAIGAEGGARMTGGGFGGAVVALLSGERVAAVAATVRAHYRAPDGQAPLILIEAPAAGAQLL
jgi:galactokinase